MLGKILIFVLIGAVIYFMLKSKLNSKIQNNKDEINELVECKKCHCFVDSKELKNGLCKNCAEVKG